MHESIDAGKTPSAQDLVASSAVLAWMTEVVSTLGDDLLLLATESAGEFGGSSALLPPGVYEGNFGAQRVRVQARW